jgi:hypothetical protein
MICIVYTYRTMLYIELFIFCDKFNLETIFSLWEFIVTVRIISFIISRALGELKRLMKGF